MSTCRLIIIYVDPLQLNLMFAVVETVRVDAMLVTDHLPELLIDGAIVST